MACLRLPNRKVIPLFPDRDIEIGRAELGQMWGINVSRVQFVSRLVNDELGCSVLRLTSKGRVNPTVVHRASGPSVVLACGESALLRSGDAVSFQHLRHSLAVCFENSPGSSSALPEPPPKRPKSTNPSANHAETAGGVDEEGGMKTTLSETEDKGEGRGCGLMLVLVGVVASGKSTFCKELVSLGKWVRINQDTINKGRKGTRKQCLAAAEAALKEGKNCIVDRTNITPEQRVEFIEVANKLKAPVHGVCLNLEPSLCVERVTNRVDHEGGVQGKGAAVLIHTNYSKLSGHGPPTLAEGFKSVRVCNTPGEVSDALAFWKRVSQSECLADSGCLREVDGRVVGTMIDWRGRKRKGVSGRKSPKPGPKALVHGQNAFEVMMNNAQRNASTGKSVKASKGGAAAARFAAGWQQALHKKAMSPDQYKEEHPEMQVDDQCIVIRDVYPKAKHHFLVVARDPELDGIRDLRPRHVDLLVHMNELAQQWVSRVKSRESGAEFQVGFHSVPSMRQLHLHVISRDFDSACLKNKKHWNSFTTRFFKHFEDVKDELEQTGKVAVNEPEAEALLKSDLACHKCRTQFRTMPQLKQHIAQCNAQTGE